jgi:phosphate transport system substrate-binding protein
VKKYTIILALLALVLSLGFIGCDEEGEEADGEDTEETAEADGDLPVIAVNGSTTVTPIMQKVAEVYEGAELTISGTGSGDGIKALIDNNCDVAMASRKMKDKEAEEAAANGVETEEVVIAKDGIAIVVHPDNPVEELTMEQLKEIYLGNVTDWSEFDGSGEITVVTRESSSGTFGVFSKLVMDKEPVVAEAVQQKSNGDVVRTVTGAEGAIGFIGLGYLDDSLKGLKIDGVTPSVETVVDGSYPISRDLNLYVPADHPEHVAALLEWIKSPEGQKIVEEEGFVPLN